MEKFLEWWYDTKIYSTYIDILYWFRYRLWPNDMYHIVRTGLPPRYYDCDHRLLHASFQLLNEYVDAIYIIDKTKPRKNAVLEYLFNMSESDEATIYDKEVLELYVWWNYIRPHRWEEVDLEPTIARPKDYNALEVWGSHITPEHPHYSYAVELRRLMDKRSKLSDQYDCEDDIMLERLVKIRRSLWN